MTVSVAFAVLMRDVDHTGKRQSNGAEIDESIFRLFAAWLTLFLQVMQLQRCSSLLVRQLVPVLRECLAFHIVCLHPLATKCQRKLSAHRISSMNTESVSHTACISVKNCTYIHTLRSHRKTIRKTKDYNKNNDINARDT